MVTVRETARVVAVTCAEDAVAEPVAVRCPICGTAIEFEPYFCRTCKTPHHAECWHYNGGCAIYGCRGTPSALEPTATPAQEPASAAVDGRRHSRTVRWLIMVLDVLLGLPPAIAALSLVAGAAMVPFLAILKSAVGYVAPVQGLYVVVALMCTVGGIPLLGHAVRLVLGLQRVDDGLGQTIEVARMLTTEELEKRFAGNPKNCNVAEELAFRYMSAGRRAQAREIFEGLVHAQPANRQYRMRLEQLSAAAVETTNLAVVPDDGDTMTSV